MKAVAYRTPGPIDREDALQDITLATPQAVGPEVQDFKSGEAVFYSGSLARPGTNGEYQLVDERIVGHKPASLSDAEAAALPLTAVTAGEMLFDRLEGSSALLCRGATRSWSSAARAASGRSPCNSCEP